MVGSVPNSRLRNEIFFTGFIIVLNRLSEYMQPVIKRRIHPDEVWLYKNPRTPSFITSFNNIIICIVVPLSVFVFFYSLKKNFQDLLQATLGVAFSASVTGLLTNIIKNFACRPRPDFFERCFPDGVFRENMPNSCTGNNDAIIEGMKSFPSGHSSLAFASLGFTTLYVAGKLHCFNQNGRAPWRLVVAFVPTLMALLIALSRTADYHHHWQDVVVGSCLGMGIAYVTYRLKYPPLSRSTCHVPYVTAVPHCRPDQYGALSPQQGTPPDRQSILKIVLAED